MRYEYDEAYREAVVRRLVDPDHENKLSRVTQALAALGQQLVVDVKDTPNAGART